MKQLNTICGLLFFAIAACSFVTVHAQTIAGTVPPGAVLTTPNISLVISGWSDSAEVDLNCDMVNDLKVVLFFGDPSIGLTSYARFTPLDSNLQFCTYINPGFSIPLLTLHDPGDTLICSGSSSWSNDPNLYAGYFGCFCPTGPEEEIDRFVHFRFGAQEGWIKISFDVNNVATIISVAVHEFSAWCITSGIDDNDASPALVCYPNPSLDGTITVETQLDIRQVAVYDSKGALIRQSALLNGKMQLPDQPGLYFLEFADEYGAIVRHKAIRR